MGYYNKYVLHNQVQIGFIGAIRNYDVSSLAPVGATISTTVNVLEEIFGMTMAHAEVSCDGEIIATAEIKLAVKIVDNYE